MRLKNEDILKPGAVLIVEKIDFNDPEVQKLVRLTRLRQRQIMRMKRINPKVWDMVITI